jgi:ubiquitin thioesterase protein OTUB1
MVAGAGAGMQEFCAREVEPMGVECEHVQIAALTDMIGLRVDIEYLDGR